MLIRHDNYGKQLLLIALNNEYLIQIAYKKKTTNSTMKGGELIRDRRSIGATRFKPLQVTIVNSTV